MALRAVHRQACELLRVVEGTGGKKGKWVGEWGVTV
jgi:hypothetical protein